MPRAPRKASGLACFLGHREGTPESTCPSSATPPAPAPGSSGGRTATGPEVGRPGAIPALPCGLGGVTPGEGQAGLGGSQFKAATTFCRHTVSLLGSAGSDGRTPRPPSGWQRGTVGHDSRARPAPSGVGGAAVLPPQNASHDGFYGWAGEVTVTQAGLTARGLWSLLRCHAHLLV